MPAQQDPNRGALEFFEYRFPASPQGARLARQVLALWLHEQPVSQDDAFDLLLACAELCSNAVQHGASDADTVGLAARVEGGGVLLEVHDDGHGFTLSGRRTPPAATAEGGRGLQLVSEVTDAVEVRSDDGQTVVRCFKGDVLDGTDRSPQGERNLVRE